MKNDCDLLILGAGPAGSALANQLARTGFDVVLADRKDFPRHKPCGEFISPAARPFLRELGVTDALLRAGVRQVHGMTLSGFGAVAAGVFRAPAEAPAELRRGFALRRELFDAELLAAARKAGARWLPRHEFRALLRAPDGTVTGATLCAQDRSELTLRARFVIGADGVRSPVARALGVQQPIPWLDRFALVTRFEGVVPDALAEVHLFSGGYYAATTVDAGIFSLNLVVDRTALADHGRDWDGFHARHLAEAPRLAARLARARRIDPWRGIGPLAFKTSRQAMPGVALVGDACGYVDPITGEGIYFALFTARRLAASLSAALAAPARAATELAAYAADRRREVEPRLWMSRLLQRGLRRPWIAHRALHLLQRAPALTDLLVTLTGDSAHPRDLLRPGFWRQFCAARRAPA